MIFEVSEECLALGLRSGAIVFCNVEVGATSPQLRAEIAQEVQAIRGQFADVSAIRALPEVCAFQEILRKVGVNPRREPPSVERLLTSALKRGDLPSVNCLVDAYNLVSVRSRCSLGAHDLDHITPPVTLRFLRGDETFIPLGTDTPAPVTTGEFGYVDAANRLVCRLDLRQADVSKVTPETRNALVIVEGTAAHSPAVLRQAMAAVIDQVSRHCGGTAEVVAWPCESAS